MHPPAQGRRRLHLRSSVPPGVFCRARHRTTTACGQGTKVACAHEVQRKEPFGGLVLLLYIDTMREAIHGPSKRESTTEGRRAFTLATMPYVPPLLCRRLLPRTLGQKERARGKRFSCFSPLPPLSSFCSYLSPGSFHNELLSSVMLGV